MAEMKRKTISPMYVRRVQSNAGSHLEPPFDESWDDEIKLAWHAGVLEADTGIRVWFSIGDYKIMRRGKRRAPDGYYSINTRNMSASPFRFSDAVTYLHGVSRGAEEAGRLAAERQHA